MQVHSFPAPSANEVYVPITSLTAFFIARLLRNLSHAGHIYVPTNSVTNDHQPETGLIIEY